MHWESSCCLWLFGLFSFVNSDCHFRCKSNCLFIQKMLIAYPLCAKPFLGIDSTKQNKVLLPSWLLRFCWGGCRQTRKEVKLMWVAWEKTKSGECGRDAGSRIVSGLNRVIRKDSARRHLSRDLKIAREWGMWRSSLGKASRQRIASVKGLRQEYA